MTESARNRQEWRGAFATALAPLAASVKGEGWGLPQLSNADYRMLAGQALTDDGVRKVLDGYVTEIDGDPAELIKLVRDHPLAGAIFGWTGARVGQIAVPPRVGL